MHPKPTNLKKSLLTTPFGFKWLRQLLVIAFVSASLGSTAQTTIAVAPTKMNVLYIGVDNPLSVAASGSTDDKVTVAVSGGGGVVSKAATGVYNVRVNSITDDCMVKVFVDGKLAGTSSFRVRHLPAPMPTVGGFRSGARIAANQFKGQQGLGVYLMDFPFAVQYKVVSFTLAIDNDKGELLSTECAGNVFSSTAQQYISQHLKPGKKVVIESILVEDPGGRQLKLPALAYEII